MKAQSTVNHPISSIPEPHPDKEKFNALIQWQAPKSIKTETELAAAREYVGQVAQFRKELEKDFNEPIDKQRKAKKLIDQAIASLKASCEKWTIPLKNRETLVGGLITTYLDKKQQAADEANRKKLEAWEAKVNKAETKGQDPTTIAAPPLKAAPPKKVTTSAGTQTVVTYTYVRMKGHPDWNTQNQPDLFLNDLEQYFEVPLALPASFFKLDWQRVKAAQQMGNLPPCMETYTVKRLR